MEIGRHMFRESGAPSTRSMVESVVLHALVLGLLMLVSASLLLHTAPQKKREVDVVFYRPPSVAVPARASTCRRKDRGPARGASTRTETETECSGRPGRAWKAGTPVGSA